MVSFYSRSYFLLFFFAGVFIFWGVLALFFLRFVSAAHDSLASVFVEAAPSADSKPTLLSASCSTFLLFSRRALVLSPGS